MVFRMERVHSKFFIYQKNINFVIFRKLRGQKKQNFVFWSVFDTEKYGYEIFPKFELSLRSAILNGPFTLLY